MPAKPVVWAKEDNLPEANLTDRSEQRLPPSNAPDSEISIEAGEKVEVSRRFARIVSDSFQAQTCSWN